MHYVIGFSCAENNNSQIAAAPCAENDLFSYSMGDVKVNNITSAQIKLNISDECLNYRVGMGIDIDTSHVFYVYNNNMHCRLR